MMLQTALAAPAVLADGGIETALIYLQGVDLPEFAAFPLLDQERGRAAIEAYFRPFLELAVETGLPFLLGTPTWRANAEWGARLGYDQAALDRVNRDAVAFARALRSRYASGHPAMPIEGVMGPRADGYRVTERMTVAEARGYHAPQVGALAEAGADLVDAMTMTYTEEGAGVALAARDADVPVVISFTLETDGRLPDGSSLGDAIGAVDAATDGYPAYFMVNCVHPDHAGPALDGDQVRRIGGIRANASRQSHAELDVATELDAGDPDELAADYAALRARLPGLRVLGGCCGTDIRHLEAIARTIRSSA